MLFERYRKKSSGDLDTSKYEDRKVDKEWARKYLLDPLTAPEPSQETGLGSSHYNPLYSTSQPRSPPLQKRKPLSLSDPNSRPNPRPDSKPGARPGSRPSPTTPKPIGGEDKDKNIDDFSSGIPTPPGSSSPTGSRFQFHSSNPFSASYQPSLLDTHAEEIITPPGSPPFVSSPIEDPFTDPANQRRSNSFGNRQSPPPQGQRQQRPYQHRRYASLQVPGSPAPWPSSDSQPQRANTHGPGNASGLTRQRSLNQRFPGDMSHRPLDMIKRDARAAERTIRRRAVSNQDTIDKLDAVGTPYHHDGPYEATLASRNTNKLYSPLAAVHDSNMEALRATPRENIQDSLRRHIPLNGTSSIPAGEADIFGNVMNYQEGADLMREPDAAGGPYRRYADVPYHPDDLKGKGEPSYTIERDLKAGKGKHRQNLSESNAYEMQAGTNSSSRETDAGKSRGPAVRQRSVSNVGDSSTRAEVSSGAFGSGGNLQRSSSTGKKLTDGIKRRFGSLRRKNPPVEEAP